MDSSTDSRDENWINARRQAAQKQKQEVKAAKAEKFIARAADAVAAKLAAESKESRRSGTSRSSQGQGPPAPAQGQGPPAPAQLPPDNFIVGESDVNLKELLLSPSSPTRLRYKQTNFTFNYTSEPKATNDEEENREDQEIKYKREKKSISEDEGDDDNLNMELGMEDEDEDNDEEDGENEGPNVNSTIKESRITARRLRVAKKCEEGRLEDLDLDPFAPVIAEYVSKSHQQICESRMALLKMRDCGQRLESDMRVLTDVYTKNHEALEAEMTSTRALSLAESRFKEEQLMAEIRAKWDRRFEIELEKPTEMQRLWDEQLRGCSQLIDSKDATIAELKAEILRREQIFNQDLLLQGRDITTLFNRINETVTRLRKAFREQLDLIEDSFYEDRKKQMEIIKDEAQQQWDYRAKLEARCDRERLKRVQSHADEIESLIIDGIESYNLVKRKLDGETLKLEQQLNTVKAQQMLNSEKLDYNLQVLRRRDVENVFTKNSNSKKLTRKLTYYQHLQAQEAAADAERRRKLKQMHLEIDKFTVKVEQLSKRYMDFLNGAEKTFHDVWMMNEDESHSLVDCILHVDETLRTQHLGEAAWSPPENIANIQRRVDPFEMDGKEKGGEKEEDEEREVEKQRSGDKRVDEDEEIKDLENGASLAERASEELISKLSTPTANLLLSSICDEGGFLVEDRVLKIISPKVKRERELVTLDAVFEALGVKVLSDLKALIKYFATFLQKDEKTHPHHDGHHMQHDVLGDFTVPLLTGDDIDLPDINVNNNKNQEDEDLELELEPALIRLDKNFNERSNTHIEIQLDRCSTDTPSSNMSWLPPVEDDGGNDDGQSDVDVTKQKHSALIAEMYRKQSANSRNSKRSNNNQDSSTLDMDSFVDPKDIIQALKQFVADFPKFGCGDQKMHFDAALPHLPLDEGEIEVVEEEKDEEELERKVSTMFLTLEKRHQETIRESGNRKDTEYWEMLRNLIPEDRLRVWKSLEKGLQRVKEVLQARKTLRQENDGIRKQNEELRQLLQQYVQSGVNGMLHEPPRDVLHYGPP